MTNDDYVLRGYRVPKAVVLAAGVGERLKPLTNTTPKCLAPIGGYPVLSYWFGELARSGISEVTMNAHHLVEKVSFFIKNLLENYGEAFPGLKVLVEPTLLGSAGTLRQIARTTDFFDDLEDHNEVIVIYSDNYTNVHLDHMLASHRAHKDEITMMVTRVPNPSDCGVVMLDVYNKITEFEEKPAQPKSNMANAGVFIINAEIVREIANMTTIHEESPFDLSHHVWPLYLGRIRAWEWRGFHFDIGTPAGLQAANDFLAEEVRKREKAFGSTKE